MKFKAWVLRNLKTGEFATIGYGTSETPRVYQRKCDATNSNNQKSGRNKWNPNRQLRYEAVPVTMTIEPS